MYAGYLPAADGVTKKGRRKSAAADMPVTDRRVYTPVLHAAVFFRNGGGVAESSAAAAFGGVKSRDLIYYISKCRGQFQINFEALFLVVALMRNFNNLRIF